MVFALQEEGRKLYEVFDLKVKGRECYGVFWNVPCTVPPPEAFSITVFSAIFVWYGFVLRCVAFIGRYGLLMVLVMVIGYVIGYNIVSWVIVSMFLFVVGGLFVLFRQAYYYIGG